MNGYFKLTGKADGTYLKIFPATEGGEPVHISEINEYLTMIRFFDYDIKKLNGEVADLSQVKEVKLNDDPCPAVNGEIVLKMSENAMQAMARFYPPSDKGKQITVEDVLANLSSKGIRAGIDKGLIEHILKKPEYCLDYIVATGIPVTYGHDAKIEYKFSTEVNIKPRMNEDGTVDFHHLDNISHVQKGQVLAVLTREDPGKSGLNILGEVIKPPTYKKLKHRYGKNISLSEDKLTITSDVSGHASLVEGKVFVSNVYEVENVDTSTGNIDFEGNVLVRGNVRSGFEIVAKGDIEVKGVVEGATLIAGGQIILERGIQGMTKGMLKSGSNVITKFIESAHVEAEGFVHTESILHSTVSAKGEIIVEGKKGFVTGGVVTSTTGITARTIGSPMGTDTKIEVGIDPAMKETQQSLMAERDEIRKEITKIDPVIANFTKKVSSGTRFSKEQFAYAQQLSEKRKEMEAKSKEIEKKISEIQEAFSLATNARIKVTGRLYTDVKLTISDCIMYVREVHDHCQFIRENGEIKMIGL